MKLLIVDDEELTRTGVISSLDWSSLGIDEVIQADDLLLPAGEVISQRPPSALPAEPSPSEPAGERPPLPVDFEPKTVPYPSAPVVTDLEGYLESLERAAILRALEATRYNKTAAAEKLGISFRALRYRLKKLGLD